jgi:hypothetical protein
VFASLTRRLKVTARQRQMPSAAALFRCGLCNGVEMGHMTHLILDFVAYTLERIAVSLYA